ncbi:ATPase, AAA family [Leptospira santarosai str. CBC379]|uniref:AAA family ATPase n=1 Tax=Leptospira santarosai TaxID=28183 RepID=UPI0002982AE1|nr:ATP-binding protein [Leptospira santarosai]EKR91199.1 ATPase, AAA family [Leptospira santarosai str. CBC379]
MATSNQIKALLRSHLEHDEERFYSIALQIAAAEARSGHSKLAQELKSLVDEAKSKASLSKKKDSPIPIVRPKGELADLLLVSYPKTRISDMVLKDSIVSLIRKTLEEQRHYLKLKTHDLHPNRKLLLVGPPGCGKTMTASVLAGELGLPLFAVRLDGLISKYMGETISKLRLIFDSMNETRGIYLFDEFDSIGTTRNFTNDVGEIRRVLNSFLVYLEQDQSNSIICAATNNQRSLDSALFRRFDEMLEYDYPDKKLILQIIQNRVRLYKIESKSLLKVVNAAFGLSFAEVIKACDDAIKRMILKDKLRLSAEDLMKSFLDRSGKRTQSKQK